MKESRFAIWVLIVIIGVLITSVYIFNLSNGLEALMENLIYGFVVSLVASFITYFCKKNELKNKVYHAYFDVYRNYYYIKGHPFLGYYNSFYFYKSIEKMGNELNDFLNDYVLLWPRKDKYYRLIESKDFFPDTIKEKTINRSLLPFNEKSFFVVAEPIVNKIEEILIETNSKRFIKDKKKMIENFDKLK